MRRKRSISAGNGTPEVDSQTANAVGAIVAGLPLNFTFPISTDVCRYHDVKSKLINGEDESWQSQ